MANYTERETAPDFVVQPKSAGSATAKAAMTRTDRDWVHASARLRKRAESRIEHELDAFWDNVPI